MNEIHNASLYTPQHKHTAKAKTPLPFIRYLIYLLIMTSVVTGFSLSRYATSYSMTNAARVAKFEVVISHVQWSEDENNDIALTSMPQEPRDYVFTVQNNSEVAVRARLIIHSSGYIAAVNPTGWVDIAPSHSENITVTVIGTFEGNTVNAHIEYEQIN